MPASARNGKDSQVCQPTYLAGLGVGRQAGQLRIQHCRGPLDDAHQRRHRPPCSGGRRVCCWRCGGTRDTVDGGCCCVLCSLDIHRGCLLLLVLLS